MAIHAPCGLAMLLKLGSPVLGEDCRLALVLALDVSSSMDAAEHQLQRHGLAKALLAPEVVRAFLTQDPVALYVFEWSGPSTQAPFPPGWQIIHSEEDLARIATTMVGHPRSGMDDPHRSTGLGVALSFAANALQQGPDCRARTIDVSGDGVSNDGFGPAFAYGHYPFEGVTVNALVIGGEQSVDGHVGPPQDDGELVAWFQAEVLLRPGAFWILADGYQDYERATTVKLLRELELPLVNGWPVVEGGT